ncbi:cell cycle control protein [Arthroderma uncinatum]|uniref:cell cycle control protein n=1 Tax=Arthroderma uncinatum TaxID=74035 RepID=UPI00144AC120|nr:cell cycle control protein [Arthroderma uncinatum]KAF3483396.1 cell cycle control protein [Arthroderma uncinatum]
MLCAISGEAPQVPVVSRKSGNVFEKRLVEEYISEHGKEPVTGEEHTVEDLIELKSARIARPRPPTLTSIPSLLGVFQEEWDALALETYTLRQTLAQTRQELSTALYQHDAAVRVIARLRKERDEARDALSKVSVGASRTPAAGDAMQVDSAGLPESVVSRIEETQEKLSKTRRKRPIPEDWATGDAIQEFRPSSPSEPLYPGGHSICVNASGNLALVGGVDGVAGVYSLSEKRVVASLKGGSGAITDAAWVGDKAVIATSAGAVKVFENESEIASFSVHAGAAAALAVHPTGDIVASAGIDKSYTIYDISNSAVVAQIFTDSALTCVKFHPDGHLIAAGGADGQIKIFDVKTGTSAATFNMSGPIKTLYFSENGTWLAAVTNESSDISVWDLRKSAVVKVLETGNRVDSISWDYTGQFLLTGGPNGLTVQQYSKASKSWTEPLRSAVPATAVAWGPSAQSILALNGEGVIVPVAAQRSYPTHTDNLSVSLPITFGQEAGVLWVVSLLQTPKVFTVSLEVYHHHHPTSSPSLNSYTTEPAYYHSLSASYHEWGLKPADYNLPSVKKGQLRRLVRSHREISGSHSDSQSQPAWGRNAEASNSAGSSNSFNNSRPRLPPLPSLPQMRFPGDGYDFRRPIMSTGVPSPPSAYQSLQREDVIDLTQDSDPSLRTGRSVRTPGRRDESRTNRASRGPRFGRDIMSEVVDLEADSPPSSQEQQATSPEVQFLGSSVRAGAPQASSRHRHAPNQPQRTPFFIGGSNLMNLLRGMNRPGQPSALNQEEIFRHEIALRTRNLRLFRRAQTHQTSLWDVTPPQNGVDLTIDLDNDVPIHLDYSTTGFNGRLTPQAEPTYEPPPAAPEGFTRTAQEEDEVICPNCLLRYMYQKQSRFFSGEENRPTARYKNEALCEMRGG